MIRSLESWRLLALTCLTIATLASRTPGAEPAPTTSPKQPPAAAAAADANAEADAATADAGAGEEEPAPKQVIGATAAVQVVDGGLTFPARVDTGATTTSLHVEEWTIKDGSDDMAENVGKVIRFCIKNHKGEIEWLERKIVELATIKTSVQEEQRYKVNITLACRGVEKKVLVSLKDRSHMEYPLLLGRNFLEGDFLVDVEKSPWISEKKLRTKPKSTQRS